LDESICGEYSTHAGFSRYNRHGAVSKDAEGTPVTAKHNFGFPRTTTISICDLPVNDELRQPF